MGRTTGGLRSRWVNHGGSGEWGPTLGLEVQEVRARFPHWARPDAPGTFRQDVGTWSYVHAMWAGISAAQALVTQLWHQVGWDAGCRFP